MKSEVSAQLVEVYHTEGANSAATSTTVHQHRVIIDSGASFHLTPRRDFLRNIQLLPQPIPIKSAFGKITMATECGEGVIEIGDANCTVRVDQIILCEQLRDTLLSYVLLTKAGHKITHNESEGIFINSDSTFALVISLQGNVLSLEQPHKQKLYMEANVITRSQINQLGLDASPSHHFDRDGDHDMKPVTMKAPTVESKLGGNIPANSILAHARYGHLGERKINQLVDQQAANGMIISVRHASHSGLISNCDACMEAKMGRTSFGAEMNHQVNGPNDKAVADICGPITIQTIVDGQEIKEKQYISLITDVYSRHVSLMIVSTKDQASDHCITYLHSSMITTGRPLKHFHVDGGTEYNAAERVFEMRGIKFTRTPVHTPQRNAIAERKNRTLMEMTRTLLQHAGLSADRFWQDALTAAVITHNRVTVVTELNKTQHELWTGHKPDLSLFRVFGCDAFVRVPGDAASKLVPRSEKGIFVGYDTKREFCYRVRVDHRKLMVVSRDVRFSEDQFTMAKEERNNSSANGAFNSRSVNGTLNSRSSKGELNSSAKGALNSSSSNGELNRSASGALNRSSVNGTLNSSSSANSAPANIQSDNESDAEEAPPSTMIDKRTTKRIAAAERHEQAIQKTAVPMVDSNGFVHETRRSMRQRTPTRQTGLNLDDFGHVALTAMDGGAPPVPAIRQSEVDIPSTRRMAMRSEYRAQWEAAMQAELTSIRDHETFVRVNKPDANINIVSCKWVFAVKVKDGEVIRFKARLVARGFSQQYGVDYEETYSPVLKYKTLRILLSIVCICDLTLELMDVQTAYLNAPLKETVYMAQPEGFEEGGNNVVWLLKKALYGLKQSGREWHAHINKFVLTLGFTRLVSDTCVYVKRSRKGNIMILSLYVDDIPSAFDEADRTEWEEMKVAFFNKYSIKFLGEADWLLNMRITRDRKNRLLWLDQQAYVDNMLEEFNLDQCRNVNHPGSQEELTKAGCPTTANETESMKMIPYRRVIGLLTYLANTSRPDIAHAVSNAAQFSQNPGASHWQAVQQILRYLSGTNKYGLKFSGSTQSQSQSQLQQPSVFASSSAIPPVSAYSDANWGNCKDSRRSTTGWLLQLGNCWIDWNCHKQVTVALSSCEAEYMAMGSATQAVLWTTSILRELYMMPVDSNGGGDALTVSPSSVPILYGDNKSAIAMAINDAMHNRSKHIDIRHHFIRDAITAGRIKIEWVSSQEQIADVLTKTMGAGPFIRLRDMLVEPKQ